MRWLDKVSLGAMVGVGSRVGTAYLSTPHLIRPINILEDQLIHHKHPTSLSPLVLRRVAFNILKIDLIAVQTAETVVEAHTVTVN